MYIHTVTVCAFWSIKNMHGDELAAFHYPGNQMGKNTREHYKRQYVCKTLGTLHTRSLKTADQQDAMVVTISCNL